MTPEERLAEQLDAKDNEISALTAKVEKLECELEGSDDGWRRSVDIADDGTLPLPRLEMVFEQRRGWASYRVNYRLVMRHLLGEVYTLPIGFTRIDGGSESQSAPTELPFRDGAHAAHDAAFMELPCYRLMPGQAPELLTFQDYDRQQAKGKGHRRNPPESRGRDRT